MERWQDRSLGSEPDQSQHSAWLVVLVMVLAIVFAAVLEMSWVSAVVPDQPNGTWLAAAFAPSICQGHGLHPAVFLAFHQARSLWAELHPVLGVEARRELAY